MPLVAVSGLSAPSKKQIKDITNGDLLENFVKKLSPDGKGNTVSIGASERPGTIVNDDTYRIDLQKYNNDGSANFQIQTGKISLAALFMPPDRDYNGAVVIADFTDSLNSAGASAFQLP
jgi:hypothetical protein